MYTISGVLKLQVETGRYIGTIREERICQCCNMNVVETEYHFFMCCPVYRDLRIKFLPKKCWNWPSIQKFIHIMKEKNRTRIINIAKFIWHAWNRRNDILV